MMKKPLVNTAVQIMGKMGMVAVSLVTTGVLTRKLGVINYGNFILISSMFVFLDALADFGTKTIGVRETAKDNKNEILGHVFNLRLVMAILAFGLGMIITWSWKGLETIRWEATVSLLMIFLTSIAGFWEIIFQSKLRMDLKVVMDLCFPLAFLLWLWWWRSPLSLMLIYWAYLGARLFSLGVGYYLASGLGNVEFFKVDKEKVVELWKMTWPMGVFLMMFATYDRAIDSMLIQNYLGAAQVAWYGLAYKIYGVMLQPAYFYVNSIFPIMSVKETPKKKLFLISAGLLIAAAVLVVVGTYITAPLMIKILAGESFLPSVTVLRVLIMAALFSYLGHLVGFTLISQGGQGEMLRIGVVALVVNLGLNIILIPLYGILAAAAVTVFTEAIDLLMMIIFLKRKLRA
jgi:O-antigen/teichoic acid export membrane protein